MVAPQEGPVGWHDPYAVAFDDAVGIALLADFQVRKAIARGEFDDLPGQGKPIPLPGQHDPEWWLRSLLERERIVLLPPSIQLRMDDAALDDHLDQLTTEAEARREVVEFNDRVVRARYQPPVGPPLITMTRDVEATVAAWAERRASRRETGRQVAPADRRRRRRFRRFRRFRR